MKKKILKIVKECLSCAMDDLYRAEKSFRTWRQSKERKQSDSEEFWKDIVDTYQEEVDKLNKCILWLEQQRGDVS